MNPAFTMMSPLLLTITREPQRLYVLLGTLGTASCRGNKQTHNQGSAVQSATVLGEACSTKCASRSCR
jgi:hypothetical protein